MNQIVLSRPGSVMPAPTCVIGREEALRELKRRLGVGAPSPCKVDGGKLARRRKELRLTQTDLETACDAQVSVKTIREIEQGRAGAQQFQTVARLANALDVSVDELLVEPRLRRLTCVQGWPGVGKTTLTAALANDPEVTATFPDGVLWTSLAPGADAFPELRCWARSLRAPDVEQALSVMEARNRLASVLQDRRMLVVIDDAWSAEQVQPLLVGGRRCATVVTTRRRDVAEALALPEDMYYVRPLDRAASLELLARLAPQVVGEHRLDCERLVDELENLPLAIQVAGRLLHAEASRGWSAANLVEALRSGARLLEEEAPPDMGDLMSQTRPTVAALLRRSTDVLDETTRQRFASLGVVCPKPASFDIGLVKSQWQVDDPRPTINLLVDRGLLEPVGEGRFQLHALLVSLARSMVEAEQLGV